MPRGDKTGPEGKGPATGRKRGFCSGSDEAGYKDDQERRGAGRRKEGTGRGEGSGQGRGRGGRDGSGGGR